VSAETNLLAAMTRQAIMDALQGDQEAASWLQHHSLPVLDHLAPEYMSDQELQTILIRHLANPKQAKRMYGWLRSEPKASTSKPVQAKPLAPRRAAKGSCPQCGMELESGCCFMCD
jgi:hypothetical protein